MTADEEELGPVGTVVLGALAIVVGLAIVMPTYLAERRIDLADTCGPRETGRCFAHESGFVSSVDTETGAMKLLYDDGRKSTEAILVDDLYLEPRTRIRLERWNGDVVSILDLSSEARYRTLEWPNAGNSGGNVLVAFGALLVVVGVFRLIGRID